MIIRGTQSTTIDYCSNSRWHWALTNMGSYTSIPGKGPSDFNVAGNTASVRADEREVQAIVNHFKNWLPNANNVYAQFVRNEKKREERALREQLRAEGEAQAQRERILRNVKI